MGLPVGWVTDPAIWDGLAAKQAEDAQLKALGNGVVPQQAEVALRLMLDRAAVAARKRRRVRDGIPGMWGCWDGSGMAGRVLFCGIPSGSPS